jgi:hypothetical protein
MQPASIQGVDRAKMNRKFESYTAVALIAFVFSQTSSAAQESHAMKPASSPSATRSHQLHALFDEHWQYVLSVSPELAGIHSARS